MLTKRIIACMDVRDGQVVKGVRFQQLRHAGDPAELARRYNVEGIDEVVVLDITATLETRQALARTINAVAHEIFLPLTVGGGIRSEADAAAAIEAGADKVSLNTAAIANPALIRDAARRFGNQCIVLAIDARRVPGSPERWEVYSHGGRRPTGLDAAEWAQRGVSLGAGEILLTSMDCDGTQAGYDIALNRRISDAVEVPVIASGGAGTLDHLVEVLREGRASAVLAASIFHFGTFTIPQAKQHLAAHGIPVRL